MDSTEYKTRKHVIMGFLCCRRRRHGFVMGIDFYEGAAVMHKAELVEMLGQCLG